MQQHQPPVQGICAGNADHLSTFMFGLASVRVVVIGGEPWFVGKDVADVLGYSNPQKAIRDHCKGARPVGVNDSFTHLDPQTIIIPERDVYRLVMRSKLPAAEKFEEFVVGDILPSIRKTGQYGAAPALPALPRTFSEALRALADKTDENERQAIALAEQAPAVAAQALLAGADGSMCVTNAAKALHQRPKDLFAWLSSNRWIYKRAGTAVWLGYQDRIQSGLIEHRTTTVERSDGTEKVIEQVLVTAKGLDRLAKAFSAAEVTA